MIPKDTKINTHPIKNLIPGESGTSLVELLVAVSISILVVGIITSSLVQFMLINRWGNDQLLVSSDLQIASIWLGRDAPEASTFTPGSGLDYGTLSWQDENNIVHEYRYSYSPAENDLVREYYQDGALQSTLSVARRIANAGDVSFALNGSLLTVSITSTSGDVSETADLHLALRPQ